MCIWAAHKYAPPSTVPIPPSPPPLQTTTEQLVQANPSVAEGVLSPGTLVYIPP